MEEALSTWENVCPEVRANYSKLVNDPRQIKGRVCPKGYVRKEGEQVDFPIPEVQELLIGELYDVRWAKIRSLRQSLDKTRVLLAVHEIKIPSADALSKVFKRLEKELGLAISQEQYVSQRQKMFNAVRDATGAHPNTKDLKKAYAKVKYNRDKKELDLLRKQEKRLESGLSATARKAGVSGKKLVEDTKKEPRVKATTSNPAVDAYLRAARDNLPEELQKDLYSEAMKETEGRPVAFLPTPKQHLFLSANEDFVLYGGAAGGGKSYAILFDAVRYAHMKGYRGVIIRRSMPELRELIDIAREIYPMMFPGAKYSSQEKTFRFPSGGILEFGFLDNPADKFQYQGKQYAWIGFDELGLQTTPEGFDYLKSRLRTTLPIKPTIRCTANPGSLWVKERFIDPAPPNTTFRDTVGLTYKFIPSLVSDNPYIYQNGEGQYVKMLSSMSEVERRQLLEGDWNVSDDSAFPEFNAKTHVISAEEHIPLYWNRFAGIDPGYVDNAAVVWCAVNPETKQIVVYREFAQSGLYGFDFARAILEAEREELVSIDHVVDWNCWAATGQPGPSVGQSMQRAGLKMRRADKNRRAGKDQIHARLAPLDDGSPGLVVLDSCPKLIRELQSLKRGDKETTAEDIKQTRLNGRHNDLYDALRYALMSRPRAQTSRDQFLQNKQETQWTHINSLFS